MIDYSIPVNDIILTKRSLVGRFLNEFFYYGNRHYQIINKTHDSIQLEEVSSTPQSNKKIALKVVLLFTVVVPILAAIYKVIEIRNLASFKTIKIIFSEQKQVPNPNTLHQQNRAEMQAGTNHQKTSSNETPTVHQVDRQGSKTDKDSQPPSQTDSKSVLQQNLSNSMNPSLSKNPLPAKKEAEDDDKNEKVKKLNQEFHSWIQASERQDDTLRKHSMTNATQFPSHHREMINFLRENGTLLTQLDLTCFNQDDALDYLRFCPNVEQLKIESNKFNDEGIQKLSELKLKNLKEFELDCSLFRCGSVNFKKSLVTAKSLEILSQSPMMENVVNFTFAKVELTDQAMKSFADSKFFKKLIYLTFSDCKLDDYQVKILCQSDRINHLKGLMLDGPGMGVEGMKVLANAEKLKSLQDLSIHNLDFDKEGVRSLSQSPYLKQLQTLDLRFKAHLSEKDKSEIKQMFSHFKGKHSHFKDLKQLLV